MHHLALVLFARPSKANCCELSDNYVPLALICPQNYGVLSTALGKGGVPHGQTTAAGGGNAAQGAHRNGLYLSLIHILIRNDICNSGRRLLWYRNTVKHELFQRILYNLPSGNKFTEFILVVSIQIRCRYAECLSICSHEIGGIQHVYCLWR